MKTYTSEDLIKILPLSDERKTTLLQKIKNGNEDILYEIQKVLWKYFFIMEEEITKLKYEEFLTDAADGKQPLKGNLYQLAQDAAYTYFDEILSGKTHESQQMDELRAKLKTIAEQTELHDLVDKAKTTGTS